MMTLCLQYPPLKMHRTAGQQNLPLNLRSDVVKFDASVFALSMITSGLHMRYASSARIIFSWLKLRVDILLPMIYNLSN